MAWVLLMVAGLLEVGWSSVMPITEGFRRPVPTVVFLGLLVGSMWGLAKATESIPMGTGYVVWVGIGAVGAAVVGMTRGDAASPMRLLFLALIVGGVVGLKFSTGGH